MAISEQRYAAEWIDPDGNVHKFDDIGCMRRFAQSRPGRDAGAFVMDYDGGGWVAAERAHYVRSPQIRTPMASGLIALRDRAAAGKHASRVGAAVVRFEDAMGN